MLLAGPFCSLPSGCLELLDHIAMMMLLWSHSLLALALCFSTRTWISHFCNCAEVRAGEDAFCRVTHVFSAWDSWNSGLQRTKTSSAILGMGRALARDSYPYGSSQWHQHTVASWHFLPLFYVVITLLQKRRRLFRGAMNQALVSWFSHPVNKSIFLYEFLFLNFF